MKLRVVPLPADDQQGQVAQELGWVIDEFLRRLAVREH
jgi:hypothetical protein